MPCMGQQGFLDEQQKAVKLKKTKPVLHRLSESIPWESFRPLLDKGYGRSEKVVLVGGEVIR